MAYMGENVVNETDDPAYWLREIEAGRQEPIEIGLARDEPGRSARVSERLAELNTKQLL